MTLSSLTFDQTYVGAVGISSVVMVCSGLWIVRVLIQIEKSKAIALSSVLEDDGTGEGELQFEESTSESRAKELEVEKADSSGGDIELSPTGKSRNAETSPSKAVSSSPEKPMTARRARRKLRRLSWCFINIQIVSVLTLSLLTYLVMVQSTAPIPWRVLGSLSVFAVFLRFQIGEEIRRQRVDRLMLLLSLFLLIASMMSTIVYSFKELSKGEIYEGPARIVGYNYEQYNNTKHDPTTRTDIAVSWGKEWGCPWSGGKVCQANVQGAMCQTHPAKEQTKHKPQYDTRHSRKRFLEDKSEESAKDEEKDDEEDEKEEETEEVEEALEEDLEDEEEANQELEEEVDETEQEAEEVEEALEEDLEDEEKSNQELEDENEDLETENEMLEKEIEELKEENEAEDEENNELVEQENAELNEVVDEYDEDLMIVEEEEYDEAQAYVDYEYKEEEEKLQDEIESASDDETKEELTEELEEDKEDQEVVDEEYVEDEEALDEYADEYADLADEDYDEFKDAQDNTIEFEEEKEDLEEEVEETEAEIEDLSSSSKGEEIEEEYEEAYYEDDQWYWDEYPDSYDDDLYEDEYWNYDWDSVWGDYACEDLFDADIGGQTYDPTLPAGGDDEWPFVNIYGSCKTCEAYILDYFAEEAFEQTQEYKQQAIVYLAGAVSGLIWALLSYIKYKVMPTEENEIELLGNDGGVLA